MGYRKLIKEAKDIMKNTWLKRLIESRFKI